MGELLDNLDPCWILGQYLGIYFVGVATIIASCLDLGEALVDITDEAKAAAS